jgi:hypothetical protein
MIFSINGNESFYILAVSVLEQIKTWFSFLASPSDARYLVASNDLYGRDLWLVTMIGIEAVQKENRNSELVLDGKRQREIEI